MVVMFLPATLEIGVIHERIGWPLRWTVHAPHSAIPQPNLVPVRPSVSRKTQSSGICGTTSTIWPFPFRENLMAAIAASCDLPVMPVYNRSAGTASEQAVIWPTKVCQNVLFRTKDLP